MARMANYNTIKKTNHQNGVDIGQDNLSAKQIGISYGKYKAGMKPPAQTSEYAVATTQHLKKTEKSSEEEVKPVAAIKIR